MRVCVDSHDWFARLECSLRRSLQRLRSAVVWFRDSINGLVYPQICEYCRCRLRSRWAGFRHDASLCFDCQRKFTSKGHTACRKCGAAIGPNLPETVKCLQCRTRGYRFREVIRLGVYQDDLRKAVARGKMLKGASLSVAMTVLLLTEHRERLEGLQADVLTCVPQHWSKRLSSNHHQAETIALRLSRQLKIRFDRRLIRKIRRTPDQSDLSRLKRIKNLRDVFRVHRRHRVAGKTILLVDDVFTTGTTVNECTKTLRAAGARAVIVVVIARVP